MKIERKLDLILNEKAKYDVYFDGMLKKWKIKSPAELSKKEKIKFFSEVDKGWKGKNEKD